MLLPDEAIEAKLDVTWIHALDLLSHILKGDKEDTMYNANTTPGAAKHLLRLSSELDSHRKRDNFANILEKSYQKKKKRVIEEFSEEGELDVDRYLEKSKTPFVRYPYKREYFPQETLVMDATVPSGDKKGRYMIKRHEDIYKIACTSESEGRPCRVIAVIATKIPEKGVTPMLIMCVIKDFQDPIFPGIWGALKTNQSANDFAVCVAAFFIGTKAYNCGTATKIDIDDYIPRKELTLIRPKFISLSY